MLAAGNVPDREMPWAASGSLGFHLAIIVALALLPAAPRLLLPQDEAVTVEIVAPPPLSTMQAGAAGRATCRQACASAAQGRTNPPRRMTAWCGPKISKS